MESPRFDVVALETVVARWELLLELRKSRPAAFALLAAFLADSLAQFQPALAHVLRWMQGRSQRTLASILGIGPQLEPASRPPGCDPASHRTSTRHTPRCRRAAATRARRSHRTADTHVRQS